ncbi:MAG: PP2C family protein-serine/threonine phosphatase [Mycobacteriales bacterium]
MTDLRWARRPGGWARYRSTHSSDAPAFLLLCGAAAAICLAAAVANPEWVPTSGLVLPLLGGALWLRLRAMTLLVVVVGVAFVVDLAAVGMEAARPGAFAVLAAGSAIGLTLARTRDELGVPGLRGEGMLLELRSRLRQQGELPSLPAAWGAEVLQRSAGGVGFGGDFVVSAVSDGGRRLEVALVDVSGKGFEAGTRALLLSGALGGLLGAVPPDQFLRSANGYLYARDWGEGFATAVHVAIDLTTGEYLLESAGHPPAAHFRAGSGNWTLSTVAGMALGLAPATAFAQEHGVLSRGDALLLYTDGLVEVPGWDLTVGIDQLLGEANRLVVTTFEGGARRLIDAMTTTGSDDQAIVLLWRR